MILLFRSVPVNVLSSILYESVQLNVQASVGSKVNFGMNYNTETSFDFDSKKLEVGVYRRGG